MDQKTPQQQEGDETAPEVHALNPLEKAIQKILSDNFDEHEGFCLAVILQHSVCKFSEGLVLGPLSIEQILELLRTIRGSFSSKAAESFPTTESLEAPESEEALEEWFAQLPKVLAQDPVLSNHDRLTILRLTEKLLAAGDILAIIPAEGTKALIETADGHKVELDIK